MKKTETLKNTEKITKEDYDMAVFMVRNVSSVAPQGSPAARAIIRCAEKIMILYGMQRRGFVQKTKKTTTKNTLAQYQQYAAMFREAFAAQMMAQSR